jgi:hypothetical protein
MDTQFPPPLTVGNRVWTTRGYLDHGPIDGPKSDIAPNMGGTITERGNVRGTGSPLYTVHWDNGQLSKHYSNGLFCIGRFQSRSEFEDAISVGGPVELTLGPQGGFRHAKLILEYDGNSLDVEVYDRRLWFGCLEHIAETTGAIVNTVHLPPKTRKTRST